MSELDLEAIKARVDAATPGDWGVEDPMDHCLTIVSNPGDPVYDWKWVATCDWPDEDDHLVTAKEVKANADLIANAPRDLRALVAEVERLRGAGKGDWHLRHETDGLRLYDGAVRVEGPWGHDDVKMAEQELVHRRRTALGTEGGR